MRRARAGSAMKGIAVLVASVALVASCRGLVVGDGVDSTDELCELLRRCFGDDACDTLSMRNRFNLANDGDREKFLTTLTANQCLSSCSAAKACWDAPPVCKQGIASCSSKEECCQFTAGKAACDEDASACCIPRSVPCTPYDPANPDVVPTPCCGNRTCTKVNSDVFTCGGDAPCVDLGQPCKNDASCCSNQCQKAGPDAPDGVCVQKICGDINVGCGGPDDCCPGLCCAGIGACPALLSGESGVCRKLACQPGEKPGDPCTNPQPCDPNSVEPQCCNDPAAPAYQCVRPVGTNDAGICTPIPAVLPPGFDCSSDEGCCPIDGAGKGICGVSGVCQVSQSTCTPYDPLAYAAGGLDNCGGNLPECCGGCFGNKCACGLSTCHDPAIAGPPLGCAAPSSPAPTPEEKRAAAWEACALAVCEKDPACCCVSWENTCVLQALNLRATSQGTVCAASNLQ